MIFNNIINKDNVLTLQKEALEAKTPKKIKFYRNSLFSELSTVYLELKHFDIIELQFNFPDTTSFLRFHEPSKFGDNLKDIRYSLVIANTKHKKISGFEEGRIFNGYRFIYPLFYENKHIGSVETSVNFSAIQKQSELIYNTRQYMILSKDIVKNKIFSDKNKNYKISSINDFFFHEQNAFVGYQKKSSNEMGLIKYDIFNKINQKLKKTISLKQLKKYKQFIKYININNNYYSINFLPIKNIKNKNIGYIISYHKCERYTNIIKKYKERITMILIILMILSFFIYKMQKSQERLENLNKKANIQKKKALIALDAKSEFLANMSHEVRTPLNAIVGFIDLLKEEDKGRKSLEYIETISSSSKDLLNIIEDILDFSKIESKKLSIDKIDFNTKKEFKIITYLFDAKANEKNITLILDLNKNLPKSINTDPLRIKQIISNLLSNAIKFTSEGKSIFVNIEYKNNSLHVSVKDEGKGVAKDKLEHIFEAFSQEDSSTTREFGGTGLGLAISSELVKLLGGKLKVKSEVGVGSEFYFSIPVDIGKEIVKTDKVQKDINFEGKKVLLVEDNKANQMFMKVILKKMKLKFDIANDGVEAIEAFKNNKYDVILMDENMPNMNGIEATKWIIEIEKQQDLKHTPIIALTANALKGDREKFLKAGMDEYITKPLDKNMLNEILNNFFTKSI